MEKEQNNLERFKGKNPFTVPDGYMKDLTANIMSQLPDKPKAEAKKVSMMDRARPWFIWLLYLPDWGCSLKQ